MLSSARRPHERIVSYLRVLGDFWLRKERHRQVAPLLLFEEELSLCTILPRVPDAGGAEDASFRENPLCFCISNNDPMKAHGHGRTRKEKKKKREGKERE